MNKLVENVYINCYKIMIMLYDTILRLRTKNKPEKEGMLEDEDRKSGTDKTLIVPNLIIA